jgi:hypothetical protein
MPSCPLLLSPQHHSVSSPLSAHEKSLPAAMCPNGGAHVAPSPTHPVLHWHVNDELVFVHVAFTSHGFVEHSFVRHVNPSPTYPALHAHANVPVFTSFVHVAFGSHGPGLFWHWFTSVHVTPFPVNPELHAHRYVPGTLVHVACAGSQSSVPSAHSLMSSHTGLYVSGLLGSAWYPALHVHAYPWAVVVSAHVAFTSHVTIPVAHVSTCVHVYPSPEYDALHVHTAPVGPFEHAAFASHPTSPSVQSDVHDCPLPWYPALHVHV